jgi:hypothetical protein
MKKKESSMGRNKHLAQLEDITLEDINIFIDSGDRDNAPAHIVEYLQLMEKTRNMFQKVNRFGSRDNIINHLVKVDGLTRHLASQVYDDMQEHFYCERKISRDAWRHIIAEKQEKLINTGIMLAKDTKDLTQLVKALNDMAKTLRLDQPDPIQLDEEAVKPWIIYDIDADRMGMPHVSRSKLKEQIAQLPDITDKQRRHLMEQALVLPLKLFVEDKDNAFKD